MTRLKTSLNMVLLGPPGAGKGTQADILVKEYGLLHISTGQMLRDAVKEGGETGKKIADFMNRGELVPDEIVTQGVIDRISRPDAGKGFILDGYPRNPGQAGSLDEALDRDRNTLHDVLYFRTSEEVAVQRLSGRRVCLECGKNYHILNMPPKKDGICDVCGAELYQRDDDKPDTIKKRFLVYQEKTKDLIDYYSRKGLLREMDGDLPAMDLFEAIDQLFRREGRIDDDPHS